MNFLRLSLFPRSFTVASRIRLGVLPFVRHGLISRTLVIKHALETNTSSTLSTTGHSQETTIPRQYEVHPDDRTIFVGKMNPITTQETLKKYLSDYGDIEEMKVLKSEKSKNSCAFVVFKDVSSVAKSMQQPLVIDLRPVRIEKYKKLAVREKKIYVGIKSSLVELSEDDLRVYFSQFGTVETVDFVYDFESKKRKDFCFVGFSSEESVLKALASPTQKIGEHLIEVRKSTARAGRDFSPCKIMLEDLPHDVTVEDIQEYFQAFGNLSHIDMVFYRAAGTQPRNFAFVTFTDSKTVDRLTREESMHMIKGRAVCLHKAVSHSESRDRDLKVFIENLSPRTDFESIKTYFGTFGGVHQIQLVESWLEKHDNQCGIVKFVNSGGVTDTMSCRNHVLDGSVITVRRLGLTVKHKTHLPISSFFAVHKHSE